MKNKKRMGVILAVMLIAVGVLTRTIGFKNAPITNEMKLSDLQKLDIKVEYVNESSSHDQTYYDDFAADIVSAAEECDYIFLAEPTGDIYFNSGVILEQVKVKRQISGQIEEEYVWVHNGLDDSLVYEDGSVVLNGMDRSFMQEDCEYLILAEDAVTNAHSRRKVFREAENIWIGCFNVTRDSTQTVDGTMADYNPQLEYYSMDSDRLECYNTAKHELMKKYLDS